MRGLTPPAILAIVRVSADTVDGETIRQTARRLNMPRYLIQATYNADARKALVANPQDRSAGVAALMERLGGKLECFYFSMGEFDVAAIAELPDDVTAVAGAMAVTAAGHLTAYQTTKLLTSDEMMKAMTKAHDQTYAAPSGD
jgi:uncharacterized protein with GYD domain